MIVHVISGMLHSFFPPSHYNFQDFTLEMADAASETERRIIHAEFRPETVVVEAEPVRRTGTRPLPKMVRIRAWYCRSRRVF
jgi:hypothetical protein